VHDTHLQRMLESLDSLFVILNATKSIATVNWVCLNALCDVLTWYGRTVLYCATVNNPTFIHLYFLD
jgi:hypothetical protein